MAEIAFKENSAPIANADTLTGSAYYKLVLVAGSATATLTLTVGGVEILALSAVTGDTKISPCLKLGRDVVGTFALAGTGAKAFAVREIE